MGNAVIFTHVRSTTNNDMEFEFCTTDHSRVLYQYKKKFLHVEQEALMDISQYSTEPLQFIKVC